MKIIVQKFSELYRLYCSRLTKDNEKFDIIIAKCFYIRDKNIFQRSKTNIIRCDLYNTCNPISHFEKGANYE